MTTSGLVLSARDAADAPAPAGGYAQSVDIVGARRLLFVSGQVPVDAQGRTPADFDGQCRLVWRNLVAQLRTADMTLDNLVKVTTYLSDRRFGDANGAIRREILGARQVALTVVVAGIFDGSWMLEIEAVAAQ